MIKENEITEAVTTLNNVLLQKIQSEYKRLDPAADAGRWSIVAEARVEIDRLEKLQSKLLKIESDLLTLNQEGE